MKLLILFSIFIMLSGCVVNQHIPLSYLPDHSQIIGNGELINVKVTDDRPYIKDGDKELSYIGHYRGGYGNTWDVRTEGERPLSECIATDVKSELRAIGYSPSNNAKKTLAISIKDFNFDAYINGRFWYEIDVDVFKDGIQLAKTTIKKSEVINGSFWTGAKDDMERDIPMHYGFMIQNLVRANRDTIEALSK